MFHFKQTDMGVREWIFWGFCEPLNRLKVFHIWGAKIRNRACFLNSKSTYRCTHIQVLYKHMHMDDCTHKTNWPQHEKTEMKSKRTVRTLVIQTNKGVSDPILTAHLLDSALKYTMAQLFSLSPQNGRGWKGPLEVTFSTPLLRQGHLEQGCPEQCPGGFWISPRTEFPFPDAHG